MRSNPKPTIETTRKFWETSNKSSSRRKRMKNFLGGGDFKYSLRISLWPRQRRDISNILWEIGNNLFKKMSTLVQQRKRWLLKKTRFSRKYKVYKSDTTKNQKKFHLTKRLKRCLESSNGIAFSIHNVSVWISSNRKMRISFFYTGMVNSQCELFKINKISKHMFICLTFVQGLTALKDDDICSRILTNMEQDPEVI